MIFPAMALPQPKTNCTITETWAWECPSIDIQNAKELNSCVEPQTDAVVVHDIFFIPNEFYKDFLQISFLSLHTKSVTINFDIVIILLYLSSKIEFAQISLPLGM